MGYHETKLYVPEPQSQYHVLMQANNGDTATSHYTKHFSSNIAELYDSMPWFDLVCCLSHFILSSYRVVNKPIVPMACLKGLYVSSHSVMIRQDPPC